MSQFRRIALSLAAAVLPFACGGDPGPSDEEIAEHLAIEIVDGPEARTAATEIEFAFELQIDDAIDEDEVEAAAIEFSCRLNEGEWTACESPHTVSGLPDGAHAFEVRALVGGEEADRASSEWEVDTVGPEAAIEEGPDEVTSETDATFAFHAEGAEGFECRLDEADWAACESPHTLEDLEDGEHLFEVRAFDAYLEGEPAPWTWEVDTEPPETTIVSGPDDPSHEAEPSFAFEAETAAHFECRLNEADWEACTSPHTPDPLGDGDHRLEVRGESPLGNVEDEPAAWEWEVILLYSVSGAIFGLEGEGLELGLDGAEKTLEVQSDADDFAFEDALTDGSSYAITVESHPTDLSQTCEVERGSGTIEGEDVDDVEIACATNTFHIGGSLAGLEGEGFELLLNGGDQSATPQSGESAFAFPSPLEDGSAYEVSIQSHPGEPSQTCSISGESGTISGEDVEDIAVACTTNSFQIGGDVHGLEGEGLSLALNGGAQTLSLDAGAGTFSFPSPLEDESAYEVSIQSHPSDPEQACEVENASGTLSGEDVEGVSVSCVNLHTVGGTVSDLESSDLVLSLNQGEEFLDVITDGSFEFDAPLESGADYLVTIDQQPFEQACEVENGAGTIADDVTDIFIECTDTYALGGSLDGLAGDALELVVDGTSLSAEVTSDGAFTFDERLADGSAYEVSIHSLPEDPVQTCELENEDGVVSGGDVTDIQATCAIDFRLQAESDVMQMHLSWDNVDPADVVYASEHDCDWDAYEDCEGGGRIDQVEGQSLTFEAIRDGFDPDTGWYFVIESLGDRSRQVGARPVAPRFNGDIEALHLEGEELYIGGNFSRIDVDTGASVTFSRTEGVLTGTLPPVRGEVYAVIEDGEGGHIIGGEFSQVGEHDRASLARLLPSGEVDPNWGADVSGGSVRALELSDDGRLYVGGFFDSIGGESRSGLAALDASTGDVIPGWNPGPNNAVRSLELSGQTLYVGGEFSSIGGESRDLLAAVDAENGAIQTAFDAGDAGGTSFPEIQALLVSQDTLYVGGDFREIGGEERNRLAAVDAETGALDLTWDPDAGDDVLDMALAGDTLYVAGAFRDIGDHRFRNIASVDVASGEVDPEWEIGFGSILDEVRSLELVEGTLYAGGDFDEVEGEDRHGMAAFDAASGAVDPLWTPRASGSVYDLAVGENTIRVGGTMSRASGTAQRGLAVIDPETGLLDPDWDLEVDGTVQAMLEHEGSLYVGGDFEELGGTPRSSGAAIDLATWTLEDWDPKLEGARLGPEITALREREDTLYVGGRFESARGERVDNLAAFDLDSGALDEAFGAETGDKVHGLHIGEGALYAAGQFDEAGGGELRNHLAAFDVETGALDADWTPPESDNWALDLATHEGTVYVAGVFQSVDGQGRDRLAAFDDESGVLEAWNPGADRGMHRVRVRDGSLRVGGYFDAISGEDITGLADVDPDTGAASPALPLEVNSAVFDTILEDGVAIVGGAFSRAQGERRYSLAVIEEETGELLW